MIDGKKYKKEIVLSSEDREFLEESIGSFIGRRKSNRDDVQIIYSNIFVAAKAMEAIVATNRDEAEPWDK